VKRVSLNKLESRSVRSRERGYRNKKLWHKGIKRRSCGYWISTVVYLAALEQGEWIGSLFRDAGAGRGGGEGPEI